MAKQASDDFPADDVVVLEKGKTSRVLVHLHGATVLSWVCDGEERLFLSSKSVFDNKKAIRGGIPLVFPNFGPWSLGPQHGFARIKRWTLASPATQHKNGDVVATLQLQDDDETRAMWNHKFTVLYTLRLTDTSLISTMVVNNKGTTEFDFTCLFHTYFRVQDIHKTSVLGLTGLHYVDKLREGKTFTEDRETVIVDENYDRVYEKSPDVVVIQTDGNRRIELTTSNLPDTVVWNPWEQKAKEMGDFDDEGWRYMLCVEAGRVSCPTVLAAGDTFECGQTFRVDK